MSIACFCFFVIPNGSDGCDSTGASRLGFGRHREREPTGEAHPDRADTRAARAGVLGAASATQPAR